MGKVRKVSESSRKSSPAMTPEAQENRLIAKAYNLVEQRLTEGTASSQETVHFLKLGSSKARLETEKLKLENELIKAKAEAIRAQKNMEEMYANAIRAMQMYSGEEIEEPDDDREEDDWDD